MISSRFSPRTISVSWSIPTTEDRNKGTENADRGCYYAYLIGIIQSKLCNKESG